MRVNAYNFLNTLLPLAPKFSNPHSHIHSVSCTRTTCWQTGSGRGSPPSGVRVPIYKHLLWEMWGLQLCASLSWFLQLSDLQAVSKISQSQVGIRKVGPSSAGHPQPLAERMHHPGRRLWWWWGSHQHWQTPFWCCSVPISLSPLQQVFTLLLYFFSRHTFLLFLFFFFEGPKSLQVTPWLPFKPADSPIKQTLLFLISALALPVFGQTSSEAVPCIAFTHAVYSRIPLCSYPGHVTKRRSHAGSPTSVTNRWLYIIKLFLLEIGQKMW